MSAAAPESATRPDFGLAALARELRAQNFSIGTSELADATRLLIALAERRGGATDAEPQLADFAALRTKLRPVFCKTREDQDRFDSAFRNWLGHVEAKLTEREQARARQQDAQQQASPADLSAPPPPPPPNRWFKLLKQALPYVAVAALIGYGILTAPDRQAKTPEQQTTTGQGTAPTDTGQPAPAPAVERPKQIERYAPTVRRNHELRPALAWILIILPIVAFLGISLPALVLSRTRLRRNSEPMYLNLKPLERLAQRLVPPMSQDISDRLARHVYSTGLDMEHLARRPVLDLRGTLEATARNQGIPTLHFSHSRVHPAYLLLVDVANERDPRGRFFFQWAERMQREGLEVEIVSFRKVQGPDGSFEVSCAPQHSRRMTHAQWMPLARLRTPRFGERLIVVSDGDPLVDVEGNWRAAAMRARLYRWKDRVVFTPVEPRDWSTREAAIERQERAADPGFIVLPLEESALAAWTDLVLRGQLSMVHLSDPQRYPALLRGNRGAAYTSNQPPPSDRIELLINQLRVYLGNWGFLWLAACAVPPLLRWELTLILGDEILKAQPELKSERHASEALARFYRRLVKLPWMQRESMPEWLRLRLLSELPPGAHRDLQQLVRRKLEALERQASPDGVQLTFERPPGNRDALAAVGRPGQQEREGDALYLGYMSGLTPEQLVLRAPASWTQWARDIQLRKPEGLRGWLSRLRDHSYAWWSRLAWRNGMPHFGLSRRSFWTSALLVLPLLIAVWLAFRSHADRGGLLERMLFADRDHLVSWRVDNPYNTMAFSHDGKYFLEARWPDLALIDASNGKQLASRALNLSTSATLLHFIADGTRIAVIGTDNVLRILDASTLEELRSSPVYVVDPPAVAAAEDAKPADIASAEFNANDTHMALVGHDGRIRVWSLSADKPVGVVIDGKKLPAAMALSPDGTRILLVRDKAVELRDTSKGELVDAVVPLTDYGEEVGLTALGTESQTVARISRDAIRVWDLDGKLAGTSALGEGKVPSGISFTPDGTGIVTSHEDGVIRFWNARDARPMGSPVRGNRASINGFLISADGSRLIALDEEARELQVWSAHVAQPLDAPLQTDIVDNLAYSPDGATLISISPDGALRSWDAQTRRPKQAIESPGTVPVINLLEAELAFTPDGRVVVNGAPGSLELWNAERLTRIARLEEKACIAKGIAVSRSRIVCGSLAGLKLWDVNGSFVRDVPVADLQAVGNFDREGEKFLAVSSIGRSQELTIRDGLSGEATGRGILVPNTVTEAALSPDGSRIVTGHNLGSLRLWSVANRNTIGTPYEDDAISPVNFVAFTPDGARIIAAWDTGSIRVFDAQTLEMIGSTMNEGLIHRVALSPRGDQIATAASTTGANDIRLQSGNYSDTIRFWHLEPPNPAHLESNAESVERTAKSIMQQRVITYVLLPAALLATLILALIVYLRRRWLIARLLAESRPS